MRRGDLIATLVAVPFCIAIFIWMSSYAVEQFTPPATTWADDGPTP